MDPHDQRPFDVQQTYGPTPTSTITGARPKKSPMKLIFITLGGLFVIVIILAISLSGGKNTPKNQSTTGTPVNNAQNLGKASAIDVENVNNSISQSLGSLSDDNDFPADQLDDKPLGL